MDKFIIHGGNELNGEVVISGAKNAVLPIMAASLLEPGIYKINNVPNLRDTRTMIELLKTIGSNVEFFDNSLIIDTNNCNNPHAPYELVKTMRASFYVLGPLLARFNEVTVSLPGGCAWGPRPVDIHLDALKQMGAEVQLKSGNIIVKGMLVGADITFKFPSVGATGNIMMAAIKAKGQTIIRNAAMEPEISSLAKFLNKMGANIIGIGTDTLVINEKKNLNHDIKFDIIPDRIEVGTFLIAGFLCGGKIKLLNTNPNHLSCVIKKLKESGANIKIDKTTIIIKSKRNISPVDIITRPYPGFPTDLQAQWIALMSLANGESIITEEIYLDRFTHIPELNRLGAKIVLKKNIALVAGVSRLYGAPIMSTDIRASASLILGALVAKGKSIISRIYHIDRGYENIENKFQKLGAQINRISS